MLCAARGAHYGAAQRLVFQRLAAFEILLSRGLQRAQVFLRMRDVRVDAIVRNLRTFGTRDGHDFLHQRAQEFHAFGVVENFADAPSASASSPC